MKSAEALALEEQYLSPATRIPFFPLVVERGRGVHFTDGDGRTFLDLHAMACILNTGHNHPRVVDAICRQAQRLVHANPGYTFSEPLLQLVERLARLAPGDRARRVSIGLSGADANDGAIKLARAATGRQRLIAFDRSYHGNTYGALSLSAVSIAMRRGFGPELPGVHHVPFPDVYRGGKPADVARDCLAALERLFETAAPPDEVAAIFIEPIQGDSGILVPPAEYIRGLRSLCDRHGILLVAEEVQTGIGRTGSWFASDHYGLDPDILVLGKGLGSGMPVSAIVADASLMDAWQAPGHVFCTGGNPVCCAAALATLAVVEEEDLLSRATAMGERFREGFEHLAREREQIGDVRGRGLMIGVDLVRDRESREPARELAAQVVTGCFKRGVFLTFLSGSVLRIAPPLTIQEADVDLALEVIEAALDDALAGRADADAAGQVVGW